MDAPIKHRPRLLIAEDDAALADCMREALEEDFAVELAADGSDAVRKARAVRPDVILMDVQMPRMGGLDACRTLRRDPTMANLPVLFVTGDTGSGLARAAFDAGASDFMLKPFSVAQLRSRAQTLLLRRRAS